MIGGFGMKKDHMRFSKPQECSLCNRIFLTPQDLISHFDTFHSTHQFSTFSPSPSATAAPTTFRHYPNLNRNNPNAAFPARNRFDLNYYRSGYIDEQGRFHKRFPAATPAKQVNYMQAGQQEKPKLMDLFPTMPSEGFRTAPLLSQLEQRRPQDTTVTEKGGAISSSIDLTLRL